MVKMMLSARFSYYLYLLSLVCGIQDNPNSRMFAQQFDNNEVNYNFRYAVEDPLNSVYNDHWEHRIGDFVKGGYSLLDPDGKIRTVLYEVDGKRGFRAYVKRKKPGPHFYLGRIIKKRIKPIYYLQPVSSVYYKK